MRAALWLRVSDRDQSTDAQRGVLLAEVERQQLDVVREFDLQASAYTGAQERQLSELIDGAQRREYEALVVFALDRLDRRGTLETLIAYKRLTDAGCQVISVTEPWLPGLGTFREPVIALLGWIANQESVRRSERIKAGLARRRAQGLPVGRQQGARDKRPRNRAGYAARYDGRRRSSKQTRSANRGAAQASPVAV